MILTTHNLAVGYRLPRRRDKTVAADISVSLLPSHLTCLLGPNGSGKSTLLRTLAGMQLPLHGYVYLGNENLHKLPARELAKHISVVLTDRVDVGNVSAYELVTLGRHPYTNWTGRLSQEDVAAVERAIQATKSERLAARPLNELSDGERQRIMITRALAQEPQIMVLDEPTAYLDLPRRIEIMDLLHTLAHETACAILIATHDLDIALHIADTIWLLTTQGILRVGLPEELVLDGSFEEVFRSEGVVFDSSTGSFQVVKRHTHQVGLTGEGLAAVWTAHALQRQGFAVVVSTHQLPVQIHTVQDGHTISWEVVTDQMRQTLGSLSELIELVKSLHNEKKTQS